MKTSSAKSKGRRCSAEVKKLLLSFAPHLSPDDILITSSGVTGEDLILSPRAKEIYSFCIEAKNCEKLNIWQANAQAISHLKLEDERIPMVCYKRNHSEVYVSLKLEDFLCLVTSPI